MAKQISKTAIGGFMVSAMVLLVAGVMIFGSGHFLKKTYQFVLFFEGTLKGLKVGSPVTHRGVQIGSVKKITIRPNPEKDEALIPVVISLDPEKVEQKGKSEIDKNMPNLIKMGLKAQLTVESLVTGQLMVDLDFYPDRPARLVGTDMDYQEIPTIPSAVEQFAQTLKKVPLQEIFEKLENAVNGIDNAVNSPEIPKIVNSLNMVLEDTRKLVNNINQKVDTLGPSADKTLKDYGKLARNVDDQVQPLVRDTHKLVRNVDERMGPLTDDVEEAAEAATEALVQAQKTLSTVEEDSKLTYEITNMLKELASAARSLRILAEYFERHPDALVQGKGESGGK